MKKSLLALAVLGAFAGVASAQSTVTLFGVVDLSVNSIKNGSTRIRTQDSNQLNSNRLGFRGVEDLGGGFSAGFWLEAGMNNDVGNVGGSNGTASVMFNRRSTVSLMGKFGELRLGRDYNPSFWNTAIFEANGANGFGEMLNLVSTLGSGAVTLVRSNNSVGYFLPGGLGGLYGQVQASAGEGLSGQKYKGGRIGYAAGPLNVAFGLGNTKTATADDFKLVNAGVSYNMGVATLYGMWNESKYGAKKLATYEFSASVPLGQGEFRAGYTHANASGAGTDANDANQVGLEYIYNLSKRTAMYTQYGRISNKGAATFSVGGVGMTPGATSTGYGAGIRHSF